MNNCCFEDWKRVAGGFEEVSMAHDDVLKQFGSEYLMFKPGIDDM